MKNVLFIFFLSLFSLCFFISCDPEEGAILPDVDFTISPSKNSYSTEEDIQVNFSLIPDFSLFDKYTFKITLEEYDETTRSYKNTNDSFFVENSKNEVSFSYAEEDTKDKTKVNKTFPIKLIRSGEFACFIAGHGWYITDKGGESAVGYFNRICFSVSE